MTSVHDAEEDQDEYYEPFPDDKPRRGRKLLAAFVGLLVLAVAGLGVAYIGYQRQVDPPGPAAEEIKVVIEPGTSTQGIGSILSDEGVISSAEVWRVYTRLQRAGPFFAGEYTFRKNSSMGDAVAVLKKGPEIKFERLTVPEGLVLSQIAEKVGSLEGRSKEAFEAALQGGTVRSKYQPPSITTLEGLLLPETYSVEPKHDEAAILQRMVASLDAAADGLGYANAPAKVGISPYEAIIVASLIERETRIDDERAKVARVIYNRLEKKMPLGIDATIVYALGRTGTDTRVLFKDLEIDSPYNTYKRVGLPPTPIAAPGKASLEAALNPVDGPWLYYVVTEKDGRHSFAVTGAEHAQNIRKAEANGVR